MSRAETKTFSIYTTEDIFRRIEESAGRTGLSRSAYVLSWLPEAYEQPTDTHSETATSNGTAAHC